MRKFVVALAALFMFAFAAQASAAPPTSIFGGKIPCTQQAQPDGRILCAGPGGSDSNAPANTVPSYDGTPIDVNVAFPNPQEFGDGPYPLAMYFHGFGGGKEGFDGDLKRFTDSGMAAFSMTERGFKKSCGKPDAIQALNAVTPGACNKGFIHLMDSRYEVRDAQYLVSILADEGLIEPKKIGTVGASYGGAKSMTLGALKDRIMLPNGNLADWKSPGGKDMAIAVAAPIVPPTDFAYSLVPNGRTYDYTVDNPYLGPDGKAPYGVMKAAIINLLFGAGDSFSGQNGTDLDPLFDVVSWRNQMSAGEPYDNAVGQTMVSEMTTHHSSYYIDHGEEPAPMVIAEGLTDDLFPIDEALRFYNRTKHEYPDSTVGLLFADIGHPRAPVKPEYSQGRDEDKEMGYQIVEQWFKYYLLGQGDKPFDGVMTKSQVCPYSDPSGGPYTADNWADFAPGEIRVSDPAKQVISKDGGNSTIAAKFTTIFDGCTQQGETEEPGIVTYDFPVTPAGGFTLGGAPTVIADVSVANGGASQIAARLLEIKSGKERIIARGVYRPDASGRQVIQLHGNVYHFDQGSRARLQLLPRDGDPDPTQTSLAYVRPSNDQQDVTVSNVEVRLPVREEPGALDGLVKSPLPKVLPKGYELADDYKSIGSVAPDGSPKPAKKATVKGKQLKLNLDCRGVNLCRSVNVQIKGTKKPLKGVTIAKKTGVTVTGNKQATVTFKLTAKARKAFKDKKKRKVVRKRGKKRVKKVTVKGLKKTGAKVTVRGWDPEKKTNLTITRKGKVK
ncbi:MAG: acetylxylan esterase [Solirubrobacterales bacterium]|nr:acetylxylan esterase [Solirubrobacterales bacterium]